MTGSHVLVLEKFWESDSDEAQRDMDLILELNNLMSRFFDLNNLFSKALSRLVNHFNFDAGRIYLKSNKSNYLELVAFQGIEKRGLEKIHVSEGITGKSFRTNSFILQKVAEMKNRERADLFSRQDIKIIFCTPLITKNRPKGVINLAAKKTMGVSEKDIGLLTAIGNQIAAALNNAKLYKRMKCRIKTLDEENRGIKLFARSVAHDLRSPAVGVYGLAKRLKEKNPEQIGDRKTDYYDHIIKTSKRIADLADNINSFMSHKQIPLKIRDVSLGQIIEVIMAEFSDEMKSRNIRCKTQFNLPVIRADRMAMIRIFQNLIQNSIKHGGENLTEIEIYYKSRKLFHEFVFSDNGRGISKGSGIDSIFDSSQKAFPSIGSDNPGLGLKIIKEIVAKHGGRFWMRNEAEKGASFCFTISKQLS